MSYGEDLGGFTEQGLEREQLAGGEGPPPTPERMPGSPRGDRGARGLKSADRQTPGPRDHSPTEEEGLAWGELPGCVRKLSTRMGPLGTPRRPPGPSYWPVGVGLGAGQPGGPTDQGQPEDASPPPSETREAQGLLTACEDSPRKADRGSLGVCSGHVFVMCSPTHCRGVGCWFPSRGRRKMGFQQLAQTLRSCSRTSTAGASRP